MTKKIFRTILMIAAVVLLANLAIVMGCLYHYFMSAQEQQLKDELRLAACGVEEYGRGYLEKLTRPDYRYTKKPDYRLTWIASDGAVLFDTVDSVENMENHGDRIEIREAFAKGKGSSIRYSATLMERTLYYARALRNGTVLRISVSQITVLSLILMMLQPIMVVGFFAVILSAVLAGRMAKRIVRPLNAIDLDHPLDNDAYEELTPLLRRIHQQRQQISEQLQSLQEKKDEFSQITDHMKEGLVLLDRTGTILSINPAAQRIFGAEVSCCGQGFWIIDRSHEVSAAIQNAMEDGHSEIRIGRNGREFQLDISRIESENTVIGTVLLAFDVTEEAFAERNRRQFTANVSHELKTPLQSVLGSAELLKDGLVGQEEAAHFSELIYKEASRLVTLVDDMIHLSQLDEGVTPVWESVDLLEMAEKVVSSLYVAAEKKNVHICAFGDHICINGAPGFLQEMIYNLCDNAIKYNIPGGDVEVIVSEKEQGACVLVRDTGIGIPDEYRTRIFERFFRVDQSRSKASGGTGLGLSIVKHIAQYHHASIALESVAGKGTIISVTFPSV